MPVLSNSTVSTVRMRSKARRSFTRIPALADVAVEIAMTSGIASPSACGHAITSTVTAAVRARSQSPVVPQAANVRSADALAT